MSTHHEYRRLAWKCRGLTQAAKFLLVALADMVDSEGLCFALIATLVEMTGTSRRTVFRNLIELEARGLVERIGEADRKPKKRRCLFFQLHLKEIRAYVSTRESGCQNGTPEKDASVEGCQIDTSDSAKGAMVAPKGCQIDTQNSLRELNKYEQTRAREADGGGGGTTEPRSVAEDGAHVGPADLAEAIQLGSAAGASGDGGVSASEGEVDRKACDVWRASLPHLVASLGAELVIAWLLALIPDRDDGHELRLLCPSELWRSRVAAWKGAIETASNRQVAFGLQADAGIPVRRDRGKRYRDGWRPPYAETAERELRNLIARNALQPEWQVPVDVARGWRGTEAWAAQRRAADVWAKGLELLAQRLEGESFAWLIAAAAPWSLDASGLGLVLPGHRSHQRRSRAVFFEVQMEVERALGEAWGAPVSAGPTLCRAAEEPLAEQAALEALAEARRLGVVPNDHTDSPSPEGVGGGQISGASAP